MWKTRTNFRFSYNKEESKIYIRLSMLVRCLLEYKRIKDLPIALYFISLILWLVSQNLKEGERSPTKLYVN